MSRIALLLFTAALALPVAAQTPASLPAPASPPTVAKASVDTVAKASVEALTAGYLKAIEGKIAGSETIPARVDRRADLPEGDDSLALTIFHFAYDENSLKYAYLLNNVKKFAEANAAALSAEKIRYLGVSNNQGRGVWLDLQQPGVVSQSKRSVTQAAVAQPPQAAPAATDSTPSDSSGSYRTVYTGPRGGRYTYSSSGKKVYESSRRKR